RVRGRGGSARRTRSPRSRSGRGSGAMLRQRVDPRFKCHHWEWFSKRSARAFCLGPFRQEVQVTRIVLALAVAAVVAATLGASSAPSDTGAILTSAKHVFWGQSATAVDSTSNDLVWHGGNAGAGAIGVEQRPAVYLIWWGTEWANGFQTADTD